jgi:hypothetical protein
MQDSLIVDLWKKIFHLLRYISIFQYLRMIPRLKGSHLFVEVWVIINSLLPFLCMFLIQKIHISQFLYWSILIYSFIRVLEITVYQINVLLFDPYQTSNYSVKSYRRLVILLLHNYFEVILWFATSYMVLSRLFEVVIPKGTMIDTILFSFVTMVSFGSNSLNSIQNTGQFIIFLQAIIGLFMTIISLARFIGLLPKPNSTDQIENKENKDIEDLSNEIKELKEKIERLESLPKHSD